MKKKLSGPEKYEKRLRYYLKQLKRAGRIEKDVSLKKLRAAGLTEPDVRVITLKSKNGKEFSRYLVKFPKLPKKSGTKKVKLSREAQKAKKRALKHFVLTQKQKLKLERKLRKEEQNNLLRKEKAARKRAA